MTVGNEHYLNLLSYRFELSSCDRFNDSFMLFSVFQLFILDADYTCEQRTAKP